MRRQRILSQKRLAAGGEARERASFLFHRSPYGGRHCIQYNRKEGNHERAVRENQIGGFG